MEQPLAPDALNALAPLLRVRPQLQQLCRFGAQWVSVHGRERNRWAPFHFVTQGACVVELSATGRTIRLAAGDAVVLPHGDEHVVRALGMAGGGCDSLAVQTRRVGGIAIRSSVGEPLETKLICGRLRFEQAADSLVRAALPDAVVVSPADDATGAARMHLLMLAIQQELEAGGSGAEAIATDLASALFIMVVRSHLQRRAASGGVLRLLSHRQLGAAVAAMLDDPARAWTLDELAEYAHASRASLVRMFRRTAQMPPLALLAEMRLELARRRLASEDSPIAKVAAGVGYQSESAFSRAFQRRFGMRPGEMRKADKGGEDAGRSAQALRGNKRINQAV